SWYALSARCTGSLRTAAGAAGGVPAGACARGWPSNHHAAYTAAASTAAPPTISAIVRSQRGPAPGGSSSSSSKSAGGNTGRDGFTARGECGPGRSGGSPGSRYPSADKGRGCHRHPPRWRPGRKLSSAPCEGSSEQARDHFGRPFHVLPAHVEMGDRAQPPRAERHDQHARLRQPRDHAIRRVRLTDEIEHHDVRLGCGWSDGRTVGQTLGEELRVLMVLGEAAEIAVQGIKRRGGEDSRLSHPPSQPLANLPGERAVGRGEGEARPDGTAQSLRET